MILDNQEKLTTGPWGSQTATRYAFRQQRRATQWFRLMGTLKDLLEVLQPPGGCYPPPKLEKDTRRTLNMLRQAGIPRLFPQASYRQHHRYRFLSQMKPRFL